MADATPRRAGWAFRPVPPTPRSIVELIRAGTLDAELAATLWVLIEGRVPVIVAAADGSAGKIDPPRRAARLPAAGRRDPRAGRGATETFDWLPQATRAGLAAARRCPSRRAASPSAPTRPSSSCRELSDHLPSYTWGAEARIAIRAASIGYGLAATIHADTLEDVFERSAAHRSGPTTTSCRGSAWSSSCAGSTTTGAGSSPPTTSVRPPATSTGMSSASARPSSRRGTRRPTASSTSAGASRPSSRCASTARPATSRSRSTAVATTCRPCRGRSSTRSTPSARPSRGYRQPHPDPRDLEDPACRPPSRPATLAELRAAGWRSRTVKEELRANLIARLAADEEILPTVLGYEETVLPAIENAILAGHDLVFLGERGQAKTRMARLLVGLLDEGSRSSAAASSTTTRSRPSRRPPGPSSSATATRPPSTGCRATGATPRSWPRPDITIADLIGEVDPIKVAEGRYLSDELTLHYGLIPRANRGIVAINELPDLAERIQVGLLNVLEERDVQIRGFTVRLPLDLYVVASANPEDYTSRGRIITPLKDRLGLADPDPLPADARARDRHRPPGEAALRPADGGRPGRWSCRRSWRRSSPS